MAASLASEITSTLGAMYIGSLLMMMMYGITTLQTYFYFNHYPKDSHPMKLLVICVWFLDTLHTVLVAQAMYHYLVLSFGLAGNLIIGTWPLFSSSVVNLVIAVIVQGYFTQRIHIFCPPRYRYIVTSVLIFWIVIHIAFGLETVIKLLQIRLLPLLQELTYTAVLPFGIGAVVSDILIAVALCILLSGNRSEFVETNRLLNTLIMFAINRCLLTSLVAIAEVIVFSVNPNSFYTLAIDFIIGKLYANSLLASVNSRRALAGDRRSPALEEGISQPHDTTTSGNGMRFRLNDLVTSHTESTRTTTHISSKPHRDDGDNVLANLDLEGGKVIKSGEVMIIQPLPGISQEHLPA